MPHPVLEKIDRENPYFSRNILRRCADGDHECVIQLWLPVQLDNGGWVAAVHITNLGLPSISAMPGADPLDALLKSLYFARSVLDTKDDSFLFTDLLWEGAGLPISLDRGFPSARLAEIEARAKTLADEEMKLYHAEMGWNLSER